MLTLDKSPSGKVPRYLFFPDSADFTPVDDFTIELFDVKFASLANAVLLSHYNAFSPLANQRSWLLQYVSGQLQVACSSDGGTPTVIGLSWSPLLGQPYAIAVDRDGGLVRLYIDGVKVASGMKAGALFNSSDGLSIGAGRQGNGFANQFTGTAAALRLTNGVARWATDGSYVVPSLPLPQA